METLFGEFLVEREYVSEENVLSALEVQSKSRIPLGQLAIQNNFLKSVDVLKILNKQRKATNGNSKDKFGEIVLELGLLTENQLSELSKIQEERTPLLGKVLVDQGAMSASQLVKALKEFESLS